MKGGGRGSSPFLFLLIVMSMISARADRILRQLIREEIGRNYKTRNNDPVQYYDTAPAHFEVFPAEDGFQVELEVPGHPELSPPTRVFKTEQEAHHYGRTWFEKIRNALGNSRD